MAKIDLKQELKVFYKPSAKEVTAVDVPRMNFLMIDGSGNPDGSPEYAQAVEALYALAYALKFRVRNGLGVDYAVMPLEGLWWADDPARFRAADKDAWKWTMMILQPQWVTGPLFTATRPEVAAKKKLAALSRIRFETYHEGLSAQILHIGPYSKEGDNIAKVHDFIRQSGHAVRGKHHEIYLGDPRKTAPERLQTILRQPMG